MTLNDVKPNRLLLWWYPRASGIDKCHLVLVVEAQIKKTVLALCIL